MPGPATTVVYIPIYLPRYQDTWDFSQVAEGNKGIGNGAQGNQIQKGNMVSGVRTIRVLGRSVSCTAMQSEDLDCRAHGPEIWNRRVFVCVCESQRYTPWGAFRAPKVWAGWLWAEKHRRAEHAPRLNHINLASMWSICCFDDMGQDVGLLSDSHQNEM